MTRGCVDWIRLSVNWPTSHKRRHLQRKLGASGALALTDLWCWMGTHRPDGDLTGFSTQDVAANAGYRRDSARFVETLLELELLDQVTVDGKVIGYKIHDWDDHQPYAATSKKRTDHAIARAKDQWAKKAKIAHGDVELLHGDVELLRPEPEVVDIARGENDHPFRPTVTTQGKGLLDPGSAPQCSNAMVQSASTVVEKPTPAASGSPPSALHLEPEPKPSSRLALVPTPKPWPVEFKDIHDMLVQLDAPSDLFDVAYWRNIDVWIEPHPTVNYFDEFPRYLAWQHGLSGRRKHRNHQTGFSNWLRTAERIHEQQAQKRQQWQNATSR